MGGVSRVVVSEEDKLTTQARICARAYTSNPYSVVAIIYIISARNKRGKTYLGTSLVQVNTSMRLRNIQSVIWSAGCAGCGLGAGLGFGFGFPGERFPGEKFGLGVLLLFLGFRVSSRRVSGCYRGGEHSVRSLHSLQGAVSRRGRRAGKAWI